MPGLLWNTMASMSAGWFFVVASEAIHGFKSTNFIARYWFLYCVWPFKLQIYTRLAYAILAMFIVILIYDQLLFRPLGCLGRKI